LKALGLKVQGGPNKFQVDLPKNWNVELGSYPIGLYWTLVNEYSKDAGFELTPLKGSPVEVWRYSLADGLTGFQDLSGFKYPSNLILLVKSQKVVGTWLSFNTSGIGPSVKKRYLEDIVGMTFEDWVTRQGLFSNSGKNEDLASLEPVEVLNAFFQAINSGDLTRANACLTPNEMLTLLTTNLGENLLYNPGFGENNSLVNNIIEAHPISYKMIDQNYSEIQQVGDRKEIEIEITLDLKWRNSSFNGQGEDVKGSDTRFSGLKKYANGWKISGLGTGP
jgi:hypothetical protein